MAAPVISDHIPPSTASYVFATAIIAGVIGYFAGQGASLGLFSFSSTNKRQAIKAADEDTEEDSDLDDDEAEEDDGAELATFEGNHDEVKLVLVVRTDLGMGKGNSNIFTTDFRRL